MGKGFGFSERLLMGQLESEVYRKKKKCCQYRRGVGVTRWNMSFDEQINETENKLITLLLSIDARDYPK